MKMRLPIQEVELMWKVSVGDIANFAIALSVGKCSYQIFQSYYRLLLVGTRSSSNSRSMVSLSYIMSSELNAFILFLYLIHHAILFAATLAN